MATYIEDPEIARAIDEMKSRWPSVGEAADHPLTEWFIRRRGLVEREKYWDLCRDVLKIGVTFAAFMLILQSVPSTYHRFITVGFMFVPYLWFRRWRLETKRTILSPFQLMTVGGDKSQIEQLWLMPVNYRDCAGIYLGWVYYLNSRRSVEVIGNIIIQAVAIVLMLLLIYLSIAGSVPMRHAVGIWISVLILCVTVHHSLRDPVHLLKSRINDIKVANMNSRCYSQSWTRPVANGFWLTIFILLLGIAWLFASIFSMIAPGSMWIFAEILMLTGSVGVYLWDMHNQPALDQEFIFDVKDESPLYDRMISRLIGREEAARVE